MTSKADKAMVVAAFLGLAAAPTLAPAESSGDGYRPGTKEVFVDECVKASSDRHRPLCECMMSHLQKTISYDDFRAMDRDYADRSPSEASRSRMEQAAKACLNNPS